MKISELVEKLNAIKETEGDIEVNIPSKVKFPYAAVCDVEVSENELNDDAKEVFLD